MKYFWLFLGDVLGEEVFLAIFGGCFLKSLDKDLPLILEHLLHFWFPPSVEEKSFFMVFFFYFFFNFNFFFNFKFSNYLCRSNLAYKL